MKYGPIMLLAGLLAGCQGLSPVSTDTAIVDASVAPRIQTVGQCGAPAAMPPLDHSALAVIAWLHFNDQIDRLDPLHRWRLLLNYSVNEPGADLAAALVTSHPTAPDALRLLGQGTLTRRVPALPASVRPVFTQVQAYNNAVLEHHASLRDLRRTQQRDRRRIRTLEAELREKDRQIEALTDIESQLNDVEADDPTDHDALPGPEGEDPDEP